MNNHRPIIVALDTDKAEQAITWAGQLSPEQCRLKVGNELFTRAGPDLVLALQDKGFDVFLDLKFHDIPNTVAAACRSAARLGVWMVNLHALGGQRMMMAAREALEGVAEPPLLIAVTVLTSQEDRDLQSVGMAAPVIERVLQLADLANHSGCDGVVCSAREASSIIERCGVNFVRVTPGIRPAGQEGRDDQRRIMTPARALASGSNYLVIGRPITRAGDPAGALASICRELVD